ncbi:MAG TPA: DUF192 domain-containing protein [Acidimicrobiales bacterium]
MTAERARERARRAAAALALVAFFVVVLAGCSSGSEGSTGPTTTSGPASELVAPEGFNTITLVVTRPDGTTEELCLWLADTSALRAQGLMGVTDPELGGAAGMVFSFPEDASGAFWMRNTLLQLSIAWYDGQGRFVSDADMDPCPADTVDEACPRFAADGPYRYAIETPKGGLADLGLVEGSTIELGSPCTVAEV